PARELDVGNAHRGHLTLVAPAHRTIADHDQARVVAGATQLAVCLEQRGEPLARLEPSDEEDRRLARRAQLIDTGVLGVEPGAVDPVGNHPVLALEVASDEIARRDTNGDVNVEAVEIAIEKRPAVVVT